MALEIPARLNVLLAEIYRSLLLRQNENPNNLDPLDDHTFIHEVGGRVIEFEDENKVHRELSASGISSYLEHVTLFRELEQIDGEQV